MSHSGTTAYDRATKRERTGIKIEVLAILILGIIIRGNRFAGLIDVGSFAGERVHAARIADTAERKGS